MANQWTLFHLFNWKSKISIISNKLLKSSKVDITSFDRSKKVYEVERSVLPSWSILFPYGGAATALSYYRFYIKVKPVKVTLSYSKSTKNESTGLSSDQSSRLLSSEIRYQVTNFALQFLSLVQYSTKTKTTIFAWSGKKKWKFQKNNLFSVLCNDSATDVQYSAKLILDSRSCGALDIHSL